MKIDSLKWSDTCCAWHGKYAEAPKVDGGVARIKTGQGLPEGTYRVCRFDADNKAVDADGDGVPDYVVMTAEDVEDILA